LQSGTEKLLAWQGIDPTTLDLSSHSGAFGPFAMVTPIKEQEYFQFRTNYENVMNAI